MKAKKVWTDLGVGKFGVGEHTDPTTDGLIMLVRSRRTRPAPLVDLSRRDRWQAPEDRPRRVPRSRACPGSRGSSDGSREGRQGYPPCRKPRIPFLDLPGGCRGPHRPCRSSPQEREIPCRLALLPADPLPTVARPRPDRHPGVRRGQSAERNRDSRAVSRREGANRSKSCGLVRQADAGRHRHQCCAIQPIRSVYRRPIIARPKYLAATIRRCLTSEFPRSCASCVRSQHRMRLLEFTILTGNRAGEARAARFHQIDAKDRVWRVPRSQLKSARFLSGEFFHVPLSARAFEIIEEMRALSPRSELVFLDLARHDDNQFASQTVPRWFVDRSVFLGAKHLDPWLSHVVPGLGSEDQAGSSRDRT